MPNSQFLTPYVDIDRNGSRIFNTSEREFLITGAASNPTTLGRYFLTAAYLMVDHDENTFTLWQANPSSGTTLVPVTGAKSQANCQNETSGDSGSSSTTETAAEGSSGTHLSGGAIAGIAVGAVAGALAVAGIILRWHRSRKALPTQPVQYSYDGQGADTDKPYQPMYQSHGIHEMYTHPTEMDSTPNMPRVELPS